MGPVCLWLLGSESFALWCCRFFFNLPNNNSFFLFFFFLLFGTDSLSVNKMRLRLTYATFITLRQRL